MKKIILFFWATIILTSCVNLEEEPQSQLSTDQFYKTQSDAVSVVTAVYNALNHTDTNLPYYNATFNVTVGFSADDNTPGPRATSTDARSIASFTATSTNSNYLSPWVQSYRIINRANAAIDRIPSISGDTTVLNRLVREAKFLRGLAYYNLVRIYGGVPLILHETTSLNGLQVARNTVDEVYSQIIQDFTDATQLPKTFPGSDGFRATSGAARSFLVSVAVTRQRWTDAINQYNAIVSGGYGYKLFDNFADIFNPGKENTLEHIFDAFQIANGNTTSPTGDTNIMGAREAPVTGIIVGGGKGSDTDAPNATLRQFFKANDKRTSVTFVDSILDAKGNKVYNPHFHKWYDSSNPKNLLNNGVNIPIIRFAEIILFYAEAKNELDGPGNPNDQTSAYYAINKIRTRAGLPALTTGLTKNQFRDSLFHERRLEFAHEAVVRWFDLVRINGSGKPLLFTAIRNLIDPTKGGKPTDPWCAAKAANIKEKHLLFPIPYTEIQANPKLTQNPGWE